MLWVLILGLLMNVIALPLAAKRVVFLYRVTTSGQPAPDRVAGVTKRVGTAVKRQVVEVFGQKKMLKWTVPGAAHFFVMWAFFILATVYLEAYGSLFKLLLDGGSFEEGEHLSWAIPLVGTWPILGFLQDFIAVMALVGLAVFWFIRLRNQPKQMGRRSRFFGSHLGPAYLTLFMIFNVIWTMFLFRGAGAALGTLPYKSGAFASIGVGKLLDGLSEGTLEVLEGVGLLLHIGVMLVFLIFVLNSKHLHIFLAPLNVLFGRYPVALGAAKPMMSGGKALTLDDLEDLDEDAKLGVGAPEDFSWKGILDFNTCTECGRCQSQCPAWNTEKPLSPKLMIMALRDATMAKAPYLLADEGKREALVEGDTMLAREVERPLVGDTGDDWFYMPDSGAGVIDPDVLWSCVTCGACVEQCPVDIEHVDHIVDMRRYQVLVESNFPSELNGLFKGMENKGNPWNMSPTARMDWAKDLPFEVKVVGEDVESLDEVEWLFWVGCAGAYEDRAKKTTRAVAELLDMAGVDFAVLGNGETCTGDSARRAGNEFVFQGLAQQNVETFKEYKVKKVVSTCAHCFNTLKNEYKELGIELEVVHHTQLLNRLVREKKLTPVSTNGGGDKRAITYHDPCYIGRHNGVYSPPRELLNVIPDAELKEMPRNSERSFCCGAGGARMWMEETIGSRINETRTAEAVATGAEQIAVGCPFCRVMLSDGLTSAQSKGEAGEQVEVLDVAQMLLASVKGEAPKAKAAAGAGSGAGAAGGAGTAVMDREATAAEPQAGDVTQTEETVSDTADVGAAAKASSSGGGSLFDLGGEDTASSDVAEGEPESAPPSAADDKGGLGGGSLFDLGGDDSSDSSAEPETPADADVRAKEVPAEKAQPAPENTDADADAQQSSGDGFGGGSLFDIGDDSGAAETTSADVEEVGSGIDRSQDDADADVTREGETQAETKADSSGSTTAATPASSIPEGGSLFDIEAPAEEPAPAKQETAPTEDAAADSTTDGPVDRSQDDADADVAPSQDDSAPDKGEDSSGSTTSTATSGAAATPASSIPEGGSLFDIEAPAEEPAPAKQETAPTEDAAADSTTDGPVDRSQDDADADVAPSQDDSAPDKGGDKGEDEAPVASLHDIKAKHAEGSADGTSTTEAAEEPGSTEAVADAEPSDTEPEAQEERPRPASSGEAHQPRTDAEIKEGGSLFDL